MNITIQKLPRHLLLSAMAFAVSACSQGSSSDTSQSISPTVNQPPSVTGSPPSTTVQDMQYSFTPVASDPDGDPLTFAISNTPSWATFNTASGALTGTPTAQHIGTYLNIMISVSDGQDSAELAPFDIEVVATATGSLSLSWTPPTQSADGSALNDLAGYRIRWGTQSGDRPNLREIDNPGVSMFVIDGLAPGEYFFVVSAVDTSDNESAASNEASGTVP